MPRTVLAVIAAVWVMALGGGVWVIHVHSTTPGASGETPSSWPTGSTLARRDGGPTVLMFVHPDCPCTKASLTELAAVASQTQVEPIVTPDRDEAARFGARTSGYVVVYDASGHLVFAGGITGSRGHAGDNNRRRDAIAAIRGA